MFKSFSSLVIRLVWPRRPRPGPPASQTCQADVTDMGWQALPRPGQPRRAEACGGGTISICQASRTPSPAAGGRRAAADAAALADPIRATEQSLSRRLGRALAQYDGPGPHCDIIWRPVPRPPGGPSQPAERLGGRDRAGHSEREGEGGGSGHGAAERRALRAGGSAASGNPHEASAPASDPERGGG